MLLFPFGICEQLYYYYILITKNCYNAFEQADNISKLIRDRCEKGFQRVRSSIRQSSSVSHVHPLHVPCQ